MKKLLLLAGLALMVCSASAKKPAQKTQEEGYKFTDLTTVPTTSVKDQHRSGTCWCYSALSFLENEILRAGGPEMDLSEMWIVRNMYFDKGVKYVRLHGHLNFAEGGAAHDVIEGIKKYGIVPQEVYPGLNYGTEKPVFGELDAALKAYLDAVIKARNNGVLTTAWQDGLNALLDTYFGVRPEKFTYEGKEYTPESFAASLPIKMDDYVSIASFTHHPFYSEFIIEVPDNWMWETVYNVPLEEMMAVVDNAMANNYSIEWSTDVSEKGFDRIKAIGIIPETDIDGMEGTEAEKWGKLSAAEKEAALYKFDKPVKEKKITQEMRQIAFDNYETTDDHGMVIVGTAVDQQGNPFFKVKNSWDVRPPYDGYYYFSRPFVEYKTLSVMVNKNAIPQEIRTKLVIYSKKQNPKPSRWISGYVFYYRKAFFCAMLRRQRPGITRRVLAPAPYSEQVGRVQRSVREFCRISRIERMPHQFTERVCNRYFQKTQILRSAWGRCLNLRTW